MRGAFRIFATRSMREYADRVAQHVTGFPGSDGIGQQPEILGRLSTLVFADGEMEVEINQSIRGKDVYLFASAARNLEGLSVEENKIEIYHAVDALRRAQAGRITLFEPYCTSSRSDRTTRRNSVGLWVHYKILVSLGVNHIITYDLHSDKSRTLVDPTVCAIDDIPALWLLKQYLCDTFIKTKEFYEEVVRKDWMFCSVDAGGEGTAKSFARGFESSLVIAHKQRDYGIPNHISSVDILSSDPIEGRTIWIVDDMIDTAGSVHRLVRELAAKGVKSISIAVIHAVFSPPAVERLVELCDDGLLDNLVVTDTVWIPDGIREKLPCLHVVSSTRLSAELIFNIHRDAPLSRYFLPFEARKYLSSMKLFL